MTTSKNAIKLKTEILKALTPVYLRTFGGYKAEFVSKEEMADELISRMSDYYLEQDEVIEKVISFLQTLPSNVVIKTNVGYLKEEILFPDNLLHFALNAIPGELEMRVTTSYRFIK